MQNTFDCIVVGAGQAGLATAYHREQRQLNYLVLEASNQSAGSWPNYYYDSLTLFSTARYSSLPGLSLSGQRSFSSATLRGVGSDAEYVVNKLQRFI